LQQEVTIINKYLNIEKARFGDRLIINFAIPKELLSIQVPPLILQPIVENAIKHNATETQLEINITVEEAYQKSKKILKIAISDNGIGFNNDVLEKGFGKGVGMKNLQLRVQQLPQGKVTLRNGTCAELAANNHGATVIVEMAL
jgi:sensor histidine kinase YesM